MSNFRANPEEAHKEFQNFVHNVASSVRSEDVRKVTNLLKVTDELGNHCSDLISKELNDEITNLWTSIALGEKLGKLHELEKDSSGKAWRPVSYEDDIRSIEGKHLRKQIKMSEKNIEQIRNESSQLQSEIAKMRHEIAEQLMEVNNHMIDNDA